MKIEQKNESGNLETNQHDGEPISRRAMLFDALLMGSATLITGLATISELSRDRTVSVDDIVNSPNGPIRYREVVCTGLVKGAGHADVTTIVGGYPISSGAAVMGAASNPVEVVKKLPIYTLYGSSSDISLPLFRDCDGLQEMFSDWKTTDLEKKLQNGDEALVQVSGHVGLRDGKQYLIFTSIKEVTPGKDGHRR